MRAVAYLGLIAMAATPALAQPGPDVVSVPFHYIGIHFICIPVTVGESHSSQFVLDTGMGLNLISTDLAHQLGCPSTDTAFIGQRMSGQAVRVPLTWMKSLTVGNQRQEFVTTGTWDFAAGFVPKTAEWAPVEGFVSLRFFQHIPFTVDYQAMRIVFETPESLAKRVATGTSVPVVLEDDKGVSLTAFATLNLPAKQSALVEIDTGSQTTELNLRYMAPLGIDKTSPTVKAVHGTDETNHDYVRYFTQWPGSLKLGSNNALRQTNVHLFFQDTTHDGIVGNEYLYQYQTVTYDLDHSRMIIGPPRQPPPVDTSGP